MPIVTYHQPQYFDSKPRNSEIRSTHSLFGLHFCTFGVAKLHHGRLQYSLGFQHVRGHARRIVDL